VITAHESVIPNKRDLHIRHINAERARTAPPTATRQTLATARLRTTLLKAKSVVPHEKAAPEMTWDHPRKHIKRVARQTLPPLMVAASVLAPLHAEQSAPAVTTNVTTTECADTATRPQ
jgi:hypothetical protein